MDEKDEIKIKFEVKDVVFDTADCEVHLYYDMKRGNVELVVLSTWGKIHQSTKNWEDLASYGLCDLSVDDRKACLSEIADSVKDKEWLHCHDGGKTPFKDESIKQAVLKCLYDGSAKCPFWF